MICCTVSSPEKPYFSLMMKAPNAIRTSLATGSYQQHAVDGHLGNKGDPVGFRKRIGFDKLTKQG